MLKIISFRLEGYRPGKKNYLLLVMKPDNGEDWGKGPRRRKGKSGDARVITCVKIIAGIVYLVSIYDKSEQANISDKELKERIKKI